MKILSLGWGVQSWTIAAMVALGELEPIDYAIHADTTWETESTYTFAKRWGPWLIEHGVNVVTVSDPDQAKTVESFKTDIPAFTVGDGIDGQLRRQCTGRWKITPIRQFVASELVRLGLTKTVGIVEQWLGISLDEMGRAGASDVKYITHRYPLLEKRMTRGDCATWLERHNLPLPPKSACVFCPYHNRRTWEQMKRTGGSDWAIALQVDANLRKVRPPYDLFVHPKRVPLSEAVSIPEDLGYTPLSLFDTTDDKDCNSGHCFL
jgi:hypothetical protein